MNGLEVSGWVDQETGRYLNGETHAQDQEKFEEQTEGELDGQITDLRVGGIYDIKRGHTLHVVLSDQVTKAYVRLTNSQKGQHEQYEVDIETGLVTIMVDSKNDYDCYLYLCGETGAKKLFQGHINFKDTVEWKNLVKNLLRGLVDAFKDNLVGIWGLVKDPLQIVRAAKFMALAILPGTEERAVLDKMLREDLFDMAYDLVTGTDIEQFCYMAGYLGGEILFTIIIGNVVSKVKDVMPKLIKKLKSVFGKEPPKAVKQAVEEVADQLGDSAKKCAKEAKKVAEKYGDDVQEIAEKSGKVGKTKPDQVHHYATNKNTKYTPQMEEIARKYNLDLDGEWNKGLLPHQGRHTNQYHEYILKKMRNYDKIAQGDQSVFLGLFEALKDEIKSNPDILYKK